MQGGAPEELQKQIFQEIRNLEEKLSEEEMELLGKKHSLETRHKERRHAKMEERKGEACC